MKKLAVLISDGGSGSNLQAIIDAIENKTLQAEVAVVVSDTPAAFGLKRAEKHSIPSLIVNKKDDLIHIFRDTYQIDYVILAGWKLIIPDTFIDEYADHILNLHPGLIPDAMDGMVLCPDGSIGLWNKGKFTKNAIQNFFDKKATYAGSTVHILTHEFDFGPVLARCFVKIQPDDTIETLYERLKKEEHHIYIQAISKLA